MIDESSLIVRVDGGAVIGRDRYSVVGRFSEEKQQAVIYPVVRWLGSKGDSLKPKMTIFVAMTELHIK